MRAGGGWIEVADLDGEGDRFADAYIFKGAAVIPVDLLDTAAFDLFRGERDMFFRVVVVAENDGRLADAVVVGGPVGEVQFATQGGVEIFAG